MPAGQSEVAKRALVTALLALAVAYGVSLALSRDSPDGDVLRGYRRILLRAHPDKGGSVADTQRLNGLKDEWDLQRAKGAGRPKAKAKPKAKPKAKAPPRNNTPSVAAVESAPAPDEQASFRIQGRAVLLTYHRVRDVAQWKRYVAHVEASLATWGVRNWCTTLEKTKRGGLHIHTMLQFQGARDHRTPAEYHFENLKCNVSPNDILGEGFSGRRWQQSVDRGMWYVWADKIGTVRDEAGAQCTACNYAPCWTDLDRTYPVLGRWAERLWKAHKLTHDVHEEYIYLCRDGVAAKKRNLDAVREREAAIAAKLEVEEQTKRLRANSSLYRPWPVVRAAVEWLQKFQQEAFRYPILIVVGPSFSGKTEWVKSLFRNVLELKIGTLGHFPEKMRRFDRSVHDGILLDDVRDMEFIIWHQEKLQGNYDAMVEFASTPGGQLAYEKNMYRVPIAVTANRTTRNLHYLTDNDFLGKAENRVLVEFPLPAAEDGSPPAASGS